MIINIEMWNHHIRQVREFSLTSEHMEELVKHYPYAGEKRIKDPVVENSQFPPIALSFYSFMYEFDTVPSPEVLAATYLSQDYFKELPNEKLEVNYGKNCFVVEKEGLIARILRTYPSILRDLHFYLLSLESGYFQNVRYSFDDDYRNGIDIKVQYNGKWYNIALMQNTARSIFFRNKKKNRHPGNSEELISIELDQTQSKRCGDYNLYTKKHVDLLLEKIGNNKIL